MATPRASIASSPEVHAKGAAAALYPHHGIRDTDEPAGLMPDGVRRRFVMRRPVESPDGFSYAGQVTGDW
jgi:hypothetical protein